MCRSQQQKASKEKAKATLVTPAVLAYQVGHIFRTPAYWKGREWPAATLVWRRELH